MTLYTATSVPLAWAVPGDQFTVTTVDADAALARRLLWLQVFEGTVWQVLRRGDDGSVTLRGAGQALTLKASMANRIRGRLTTTAAPAAQLS